MGNRKKKKMKIHTVSSTDSPEFGLLTRALSRSSLIGLDAEWRPSRGQQSSFPTVSLLQLACRPAAGVSLVFLLDLVSVPLPSVYELLRDVFVSPDVLKLGFRFKQDLTYLSSTFSSAGCDAGFDRVTRFGFAAWFCLVAGKMWGKGSEIWGFLRLLCFLTVQTGICMDMYRKLINLESYDRVEPFLDITSIYNHLQPKQPGKRVSKDIKSLSFICQEMLGFSLSKELQCSDWSHRPLSDEQKTYAAMDAHCLLEIFCLFHAKVVKEGAMELSETEASPCCVNLGLKNVLKEDDVFSNILSIKICEASDIVKYTVACDLSTTVTTVKSSCRSTRPMEESLLKIVKKYGEKIMLKESDRRPKASKRRGKKRSSVGLVCKQNPSESSYNWQGLPPWDISHGGDGCPKFLCDVMVEGLAKHLRCVGIDAAVPHSRKPEPRELIYQAYKEKRVILTRDVKLFRHDYLIKNQIYRVKSLLKNEQLLEVIQTFELKINEDQLMSRCTKCNGMFIQKPLTTEEAMEAAKGFQKIPNCLFDKNLEFWQCRDCNQLYWEGTQYHNAVQKFIDVCKLNE